MRRALLALGPLADAAAPESRIHPLMRRIVLGLGPMPPQTGCLLGWACAALRAASRFGGRYRMISQDENKQVFPIPQLDLSEPPAGSDRRAFMMRSALATAIAALTGRPIAAFAQTPAKAPPDIGQAGPEARRRSRNPRARCMTTVEEFYKVGPGPSSSHTIGPMRITYDFYQRCTKLPAAQLAPGDGVQGQSVRQPERDRKRPWHRARLACRHCRQGAGDGRSRLPRRSARQARPGLSR